MARSDAHEEDFFSVCCDYEMMNPIPQPDESIDPPNPSSTPSPTSSSPKPNDVPTRPVPVPRPRPLTGIRRSARVSRPILSPRDTHFQSTYDSLDEINFNIPQINLPIKEEPQPTESLTTTYENIKVSQDRSPKLQVRSRVTPTIRTQSVLPLPALPQRPPSVTPQSPISSGHAEKRLSRLFLGHGNYGHHGNEELDRDAPAQDHPNTTRNPGLQRCFQPKPSESDLIFPNFKKTGAIDFDARIFRCNELVRSDLASQSLIAAEDNFACAFVNHAGGYLRLMRAHGTLFVPPHAIQGDPEPIVLYFMSRADRVGYTPLTASLDPGQFLVSPIMFIGKPGCKYTSMDVVLSFPLEGSGMCPQTIYNVLTVKGFDTSSTCPTPENAKWRILASGHDYFLTVQGGRGVIMVSQSAFYVVRATRAASDNQATIRVALFGRSYIDSTHRATLHVVFCKDNEVERVVHSEEQDGYHKLDHVRALTIRPSSGQPVWVNFCHVNSPRWRLQTNPTAKFSASDISNCTDRCPPSATFALQDTGHDALSVQSETHVQCVVVAHQGATANYRADDVTGFIHLVGDVTLTSAKSGQFLSHSLGRVGGKRLPTLPIMPYVDFPPPTSSPYNPIPASRMSSTSSATPSSCPSGSPPLTPPSRVSLLLSGSHDAGMTKAQYEEFHMSYQALSELSLMLHDSRAQDSGKGWMALVQHIGLSKEEMNRISDRYAYQPPQATLHLFFGANQSISTSYTHTPSREKTRTLLVRLLGIFREMERADLSRVVRRELAKLDQETDRYSRFLFEGNLFKSRAHHHGGALRRSEENLHGSRHSYNVDDIRSQSTNKAPTNFKGRIAVWFRSWGNAGKYQPSKQPELYEFESPNFRVFEERRYEQPKTAAERSREKVDQQATGTKKQNQYC